MPRARVEVPQLENMVQTGKKKIVRYAEGAILYSLGLHTFQEIAKDAGAVYKVKRCVLVNHNFTDRPGDERECRKHIQTPKTEAGNRTIPMIQEVFDAFLTEYEIQRCLGFCEEEIDGYSGFVFSTATHTVYGASAVNNAIHRATAAYNKQEEALAQKEKREPLIIPDFSAHNLRHTFCTRFCENETNLKVIQDIMGHSDISTTMDIYAEATQEKKKEVMTNMEGCIIIK